MAGSGATPTSSASRSTRIRRESHRGAVPESGDKEQQDLLQERVTANKHPRSCIATGTRKGYTITNCDPFGKVYGRSESPRDHSTLVRKLIVTPRRRRRDLDRRDAVLHLARRLGRRRRPPGLEHTTAPDRQHQGGWRTTASTTEKELTLTHRQRQSTICELTFPTTILAVKLNRRRLVVVLEERIYVYDISNMKLLHEIETSPNPNGEPRRKTRPEPSKKLTPRPQPSARSRPRRKTATSRILRRCLRRRRPSRPRHRAKRPNQATCCCLTPLPFRSPTLSRRTSLRSRSSRSTRRERCSRPRPIKAR